MKITRIFLIFAVLMTLLHCGEVSARSKKGIRGYFEKKDIVKTYVAGIKNSSGDEKLDPKRVKKEIEEALAARRSQKFEILDKESGADIIIYFDIIEYIWTDQDPVDMVVGTIGVAYDVLTRENYARMRVIARIVDAKNGNELWKKRFKATITSATLMEEESYVIMSKRIAKAFIRRLFKKPKRGKK